MDINGNSFIGYLKGENMKLIKNFILSLLIVSLILIVSGCTSKKFTLSSDIILNNIEKSNPIKVPVNDVFASDFGELTVTNDIAYTTGYLIVTDEIGRRGCWSLAENRLIVPLQTDLTINLKSVTNFGYYIETMSFDDKKTIYDPSGIIVVDTDKYMVANVTGNRKPIYDDLGKFLHYEYIEVVTTLTVKDSELGLQQTIKEYKIDPKTKQRTLINNDLGDYYKGDDVKKVDLKKFGLDGYYGKEFNSYIYIYKNDDTLVQTIQIPESDVTVIFDGKILIQTSYLVDSFTDNYTYIENGKRYVLITTSIDLLKNDKKNLKLPYKITSLIPFNDKNDIAMYSYVKMRKINSKILIPETTNAIVDSKGTILTEINGVDFSSLKRLDDKHYYDSKSKYVINDKLEPLYLLPLEYSIIQSENIIVLIQNNKYGAIDYDGKVVIPFEYTNLLTSFNNGSTIGTHSDGHSYIVQKDGKTKKIEDSYLFISSGLVLTYKNTSLAPEQYQGIIMDYQGNAKYTFDSTSPNMPNFQFFSNLYGTYQVARYPITGGNKYIVINTTLN